MTQEGHLAFDTLRRLEQLQDSDDMERAHSEADNLLCELLMSLGFAEVVEAWEKIAKKYS